MNKQRNKAVFFLSQLEMIFDMQYNDEIIKKKNGFWISSPISKFNAFMFFYIRYAWYLYDMV